MRLLHRLPDAAIRLEEFHGDRIPPYAVLSHTWGDDEVTFGDLTSSTSSYREKQGWRKIEYCCAQAGEENLEFFWIDTCCIDKSSSAELSEAINSMYAWYQKAIVCYAYLSDVSSNDLTKARWFTRGWTLQELIGPKEVIFFSSDWERIGDKRNLTAELSQITGIVESVLAGGDPYEVSVAQRMSWAAQRVTTRVEDIAYCLLGLFDVNMPLLYGEGMKAFQRLQEEIIKQSDDQSLFAWHGSTSLERPKLTGLFAASPAQFKDCGDVFLPVSAGIKEPYSMTNRGLRIQLPIIEAHPDNDFLWKAALSCYRKGKAKGTVVIYLERLFGDVFARAAWAPMKTNDLQVGWRWPMRSIYVRQKNFGGSVREIWDAIIITLMPPQPLTGDQKESSRHGYRLVAVSPSASWDGRAVVLPSAYAQVVFVFQFDKHWFVIRIDALGNIGFDLQWCAAIQVKRPEDNMEEYLEHFESPDSVLLPERMTAGAESIRMTSSVDHMIIQRLKTGDEVVAVRFLGGIENKGIVVDVHVYPEPCYAQDEIEVFRWYVRNNPAHIPRHPLLPPGLSQLHLVRNRVDGEEASISSPLRKRSRLDGY